MFIAVLIKVKFSSFSALIGNMSQQRGSYKTLARKLPANVNMNRVIILVKKDSFYEHSCGGKP